MDGPDIDEKRAQMYWWFSSLFFSELDESQLNQYISPPFHLFLDQLAEAPQLHRSAHAFKTALSQLQMRPDAQLELAADFCGLFLMGDRAGAMPYASSYLSNDKLLHGKPAQELADIFAAHQIALNDNHNEARDHIAVILDFIGNLAINSHQYPDDSFYNAHLNEQLTLLRAYLLSWIPQFVTKCTENDQFGFYANAAQLLNDYLLFDEQYLSERVEATD
uniref:molecular chaperone TorD n=1 Tax=Thaumasiovibrio occultus TaxID=1891184 RepID=UPI000B354419|nr:molecular chaperone TorD [Thaumasiovibrio occultus]